MGLNVWLMSRICSSQFNVESATGTSVLILSKMQVPLRWGPCGVSVDSLTPSRVPGAWWSRAKGGQAGGYIPLRRHVSQVQVDLSVKTQLHFGQGRKGVFLMVDWNV